MNIDWQTIFYVVSTLTMVVLLSVIVTVFVIFRKLKTAIDKSVAGAAAVRSLAKISVLRMLLKIIK